MFTLCKTNSATPETEASLILKSFLALHQALLQLHVAGTKEGRRNSQHLRPQVTFSFVKTHWFYNNRAPMQIAFAPLRQPSGKVTLACFSCLSPSPIRHTGFLHVILPSQVNQTTVNMHVDIARYACLDNRSATATENRSFTLLGMY